MNELFIKAGDDGTSFINKDPTPKIHVVPLYKIKNPTDFQGADENDEGKKKKRNEIAKQLIQIMEVIKNQPDGCPSIDDLIEKYEEKFGIPIGNPKDPDNTKRFWMQYRLKILEREKLIEKKPSEQNKKKIFLNKMGEAELQRSEDKLNVDIDRAFQLKVLKRKK